MVDIQIELSIYESQNIWFVKSDSKFLSPLLAVKFYWAIKLLRTLFWFKMIIMSFESELELKNQFIQSFSPTSNSNQIKIVISSQ